MTRTFLSTLLPTAFLVILFGCQGGVGSEGQTVDYTQFVAYGDSTSHAVYATEVVSPVELVANLVELEGKTVTVSGTVREVCQMAGCWLTLDGSEGAEMDGDALAGPTIRVSVPRDDAGAYVYTVPKDISGRLAYVTGVVEQQEVDGDMQEHFDEDAGHDMDHEDGDMDHHADGAMDDAPPTTDGADAARAPVKEIRITAVGVSLAPPISAS